ncbi:MAG: PTS transporter subunit EIIC [Clostridium sp.]|nr:PTS transporter subunit EIIC [Clostridium sp.]
MSKTDMMMGKVMIFAQKVQNNKYLDAISKGLMWTLAPLMIGSIALLLAVLPIDAWKTLIGNIGLRAQLLNASTLTTSIIALYAVFAIAYKLADNLKQQGVIPGLLAVFSFLIITPLANFDGASYLDIGWLGAKGLFTAMIVALVSCRIYCLLVEKKLTIKMPDSVPPVIANSFAGLIPAMVVGFGFILVALLFSLTKYGSFNEFVYHIIASPLESLSASIWSMVFIVFVQMVLWFFGLHGSLVVGSFITALYLPMDTANMEAVAAGVANSELPNILGKTFYNLFAGIGGAGGTISLVILLLFVAKSKKNKAMGNLAAIPGCFTINEPVVFGLPLILNPIMVVPFISVPLIQLIIAYFATAAGIVPRLSGVQVPFGMPVLVNGFIAGGWRVSVLQAVLILVGLVIYYPFFKVLDKKDYLEEIGEGNLEEKVGEYEVN